MIPLSTPKTAEATGEKRVEVGERIQNYILEEPVGTGSHATVFRAKHITIGRLVAIKILHSNFKNNQVFRDALLAEAKILETLAHPNILRLLDCGEEPELYLISEYMPLGTLASEIKKNQSLSLRSAINIAFQAATGVAFAHEKGIVHRDLKPENLLLDQVEREGQRTTVVKVADFGIGAHYMNYEATITGTIQGTPKYMAPEQFEMLKPDPSQDIYALGMIMYEMVAGKLPFAMTNLLTALTAHRETQPHPLSEYRKDVPEALNNIILQCLAKNPDNRPQSANELAEFLKKISVEIPKEDEDKRKNGTYRINRPTPEPPAIQITDTSNLPRIYQFDRLGRREKFYDLGLSGLKIGRTPTENDIVLDADTVSSRHLRVFILENVVYIHDLGSKNASEIVNSVDVSSDQRRIPSGETRTWPAKTFLWVEPFWLFYEPPFVAIPDELNLDPDSLTLLVGVPQQVTVTIVNRSLRVEHYGLKIEGIPKEWLRIPDAAMQINPGEKGSVTLTVLVPKTSLALAGNYDVKIRTCPTAQPEHITTIEILWKVLPFTNVELDLKPKQKSAITRATYNIKLKNDGNDSILINLRIENGENVLCHAFEPYPSEIGAGRSVDIALTVSAKKRWFGKIKARDFDVIQEIPQTSSNIIKSGTFFHYPQFPYWVLYFIILLLLLIPFFVLFPLFNRPDIVNLHYEPQNPQINTYITIYYKVKNAKIVKMYNEDGNLADMNLDSSQCYENECAFSIQIKSEITALTILAFRPSAFLSNKLVPFVKQKIEIRSVSAKVNSFSVNYQKISYEDKNKLVFYWNVTDADSVKLNKELVSGESITFDSPKTTTDYLLEVAAKNGSSDSKLITVSVEDTVQVAADEECSSSFNVLNGQQWKFEASGSAIDGETNIKTNPDGVDINTSTFPPKTSQENPYFQDKPIGLLYGLSRNGNRYFEIGSSSTISFKDNSEFDLCFNDVSGKFKSNSGSYEVKYSVTSAK